ncbi:Predicted acetyltransferase [Streptoalloteichus hindustanus]|uniref:Predicted acetyltransferase n=1 Tax=Streptoalloteichus hindustanus TaxID=2017 RepID=A0A1M5FEJ1_STRHI|nr:Predicted acetyltransferase [Streptoalloteichus hindustanus]
MLVNLMQFYLHDFSEIREAELTPHGTFVYNYLDYYFTETTREAYFIRADGHLAGFALARGDVDDDGSWNVAEFFVVRRHRGRGVAREAARLLFARHPGEWTLSVDHNNERAGSFWRSVVNEVAVGAVAEVDGHLPSEPVAVTRLRFRVADGDG